jgi:uncharacterized membrane protein YbhN (UPF0104 family)
MKFPVTKIPAGFQTHHDIQFRAHTSNISNERREFMGVFFALLFVVLYLALTVDWKECMGVIRQGGWAAIGVYLVLTVLIVAILTGPETAAVAPAVHH